MLKEPVFSLTAEISKRKRKTPNEAEERSTRARSETLLMFTSKIRT